MHDLRVTLIQSEIFWENTDENLVHFGELIGNIQESTDLILLPETFNTGFSINPAICAEEINGKSMRFLLRMAQETGTVIMATLLISEGLKYFNRFVCVYPDGSFETCNKRHLFRLSDEYRILTPGDSRPVFRVKDWKIFPMTCYDLRFPVWSRNSCTNGEFGYDLIVCLANWPSSRSHIWKTLLPARSIENLSFIAAVNRVGKDGFGNDHCGDSMVADARGNIRYIAGTAEEETRTIELSASELIAVRNGFPAALDWDQFSLHL